MIRRHLGRVLLFAVGVGIGLFGLAAPNARLLGLASGSTAQIVLLLLAGLLVAVSLLEGLFEARRLVQVYRGAALLLLNTLVLLMVVELGTILVLNANLLLRPDEQPIVPREALPYYAEQAWGARYWEEHRAADVVRYDPYTVWRRRPFSGETLNIDANGRRIVPGSECDDGAYTIYAFGGSTLWGTGAPDWLTIPALLQSGLSENGLPVCIVNFAEKGYIAAQGLHGLIAELQNGHVPDMVIFYVGVNEIFAAFQSGHAGIHQNFDLIAAQFEQPNPLIDWLRESYTFRLVGVLTGQTTEVNYQTMGIETEALATEVVDHFLEGIRIVELLVDAYGFDAVFFWQPELTVTQKPLDEQEQLIKASLSPALVALFETTYAQMAGTAPDYARLYSVADVFNNWDGRLWIDPVHIFPEGNATIAQKMLDIIRPLMMGEH